MSALDLLMEQRVFPVLRARDAEDAVTTARAAARAGMRIVELTTTTPDVHEAVGRLTADGLVIGVGAIAESTMIERMAAGACFVVSFFLPQGFVAAAHAAGLEAIPGGFTPAELAAARSAGAGAVKLFPARLVTPAYLSDLAPLLSGLRLIVTGGLEATGFARPMARRRRRWCWARVGARHGGRRRRGRGRATLPRGA